MSYQWQVWWNYQWNNLPNNQEIERDYCNPANTQHIDRSSHIDFDTMTCGFAQVRRLCMGDTKWVWYWEEADARWKQYKDSETLDRRYLRGQTTTEITAGNHRYVLIFTDMLQVNITTNTARPMRRRPVFQITLEKFGSSGTPTYWDPNLLPSVGYERIMLKTSSSEYSEVLSLFNRTMTGWNIISIKRIQNLHLWNFFKLQMDSMKIKAGKDVDERLLFHGTGTQYVDAICRDNIDWRLCGKNGTYYGEGSYFARDAKYADSYARDQGTKSMFVCRVLVGDFTLGKRNDRKPPFKDEQNGVAFDSCVDDMNNPSIFVIFEKSQIYPEYLIQYEQYNEVAVAQPLRTAQAPPPLISTNAQTVQIPPHLISTNGLPGAAVQAPPYLASTNGLPAAANQAPFQSYNQAPFQSYNQAPFQSCLEMFPDTLSSLNSMLSPMLGSTLSSTLHSTYPLNLLLNPPLPTSQNNQTAAVASGSWALPQPYQYPQRSLITVNAQSPSPAVVARSSGTSSSSAAVPARSSGGSSSSAALPARSSVTSSSSSSAAVPARSSGGSSSSAAVPARSSGGSSSSSSSALPARSSGGSSSSSSSALPARSSGGSSSSAAVPARSSGGSSSSAAVPARSSGGSSSSSSAAVPARSSGGSSSSSSAAVPARSSGGSSSFSSAAVPARSSGGSSSSSSAAVPARSSGGSSSSSSSALPARSSGGFSSSSAAVPARSSGTSSSSAAVPARSSGGSSSSSSAAVPARSSGGSSSSAAVVARSSGTSSSSSAADSTVTPSNNARSLQLSVTNPPVTSTSPVAASQLTAPTVSGRNAQSPSAAADRTVIPTLPPAGSRGTVQLTSHDSQRNTFSTLQVHSDVPDSNTLLSQRPSQPQLTQTNPSPQPFSALPPPSTPVPQPKPRTKAPPMPQIPTVPPSAPSGLNRSISLLSPPRLNPTNPPTLSSPSLSRPTQSTQTMAPPLRPPPPRLNKARSLPLSVPDPPVTSTSPVEASQLPAPTAPGRNVESSGTVPLTSQDRQKDSFSSLQLHSEALDSNPLLNQRPSQPQLTQTNHSPQSVSALPPLSTPVPPLQKTQKNAPLPIQPKPQTKALSLSQTPTVPPSTTSQINRSVSLKSPSRLNPTNPPPLSSPSLPRPSPSLQSTQTKAPPPRPPPPRLNNARSLPLSVTNSPVTSTSPVEASQLMAPTVSGRNAQSPSAAADRTVIPTLPPAGSRGTVQLTSHDRRRDNFTKLQLHSDVPVVAGSSGAQSSSPAVPAGSRDASSSSHAADRTVTAGSSGTVPLTSQDSQKDSLRTLQLHSDVPDSKPLSDQTPVHPPSPPQPTLTNPPPSIPFPPIQKTKRKAPQPPKHQTKAPTLPQTTTIPHSSPPTPVPPLQKTKRKAPQPPILQTKAPTLPQTSTPTPPIPASVPSPLPPVTPPSVTPLLLPQIPPSGPLSSLPEISSSPLSTLSSPSRPHPSPSLQHTQTKAPPPVPPKPRPNNALPLPLSVTDPPMTSPAPVEASQLPAPAAPHRNTLSSSLQAQSTAWATAPPAGSTSQNIQKELVSDLLHYFNQQSIQN